MQKQNVFFFLLTSVVFFLNVECLRKLTNEEKKRVFSEGYSSKKHNLTEELAAKNGYPLESHTVVTEDGYILVMHRIRYSPKEKNDDARNGTKSTRHSQPMLMLHPMIGNSMIFMFSKKNSPAYAYADAGYDVWLSNCRGTQLSSRHLTLDPATQEFWNFGWHEIGYYDLPAMIDYIIDTTGHVKISLTGYSMGGTTYLAGLSSRPEYNQKIKAAVIVAPAIMSKSIKRRGRITSSLNTMDVFAKTNARALKQMLQHGVVPNAAPQEGVFYNLGPMCRDPVPVNNLCLISLCAGSGCDIRNMDPENTQYLLRTMPDGVTAKMLDHYSQICSAERFQNYDYGATVNLKKYHSLKPPAYNLSAITVPSVLIWSKTDKISDDLNARYLKKRYGGPVDSIRILESKFDHFSFAAHIRLRQLVYEPAINLLKKYL